MNAVGGIFHRRADAQQAADALVLAGVSGGSLRYELLPRPLVATLGPLGVPADAIDVYARDVAPGDILLTVNTDRLPAAAIATEIARVGGLVVEFGHAPSTGLELR